MGRGLVLLYFVAGSFLACKVLCIMLEKVVCIFNKSQEMCCCIDEFFGGFLSKSNALMDYRSCIGKLGCTWCPAVLEQSVASFFFSWEDASFYSFVAFLSYTITSLQWVG